MSQLDSFPKHLYTKLHCLHVLDYPNLKTMAILRIASMDIDLDRLSFMVPTELCQKLKEVKPKD